MICIIPVKKNSAYPIGPGGPNREEYSATINPSFFI